MTGCNRLHLVIFGKQMEKADGKTGLLGDPLASLQFDSGVWGMRDYFALLLGAEA